MSEPAKKLFFKQNFTLKLLFTFKMASYCCFTLGGNLDLLYFLQKKFYNFDYCSCSTSEMLWRTN